LTNRVSLPHPAPAANAALAIHVFHRALRIEEIAGPRVDLDGDGLPHQLDCFVRKHRSQQLHAELDPDKLHQGRLRALTERGIALILGQNRRMQWSTG